MPLFLTKPYRAAAITPGFNLADASYSGTSFYVGGQAPTPTGVAFNNDGTKMFVTGNIPGNVYQYTLSTGFDLSTATATGVVSFPVDHPQDIAFNLDGTKMFVLESFFSRVVHQFNLSPGFDLSTATNSGNTLDVSSHGSAPSGLTFNDDGKKLYITENTSSSVYQYNMTIGFILSTASYSGNSFSTTAEEPNPTGVAFNTDGTRMFIVGFNDMVQQYSLSTGFDLASATAIGVVSFSLNSQTENPLGIAFSPDGKGMYVTGDVNDVVSQYNL